MLDILDRFVFARNMNAIGDQVMLIVDDGDVVSRDREIFNVEARLKNALNLKSNRPNTVLL